MVVLAASAGCGSADHASGATGSVDGTVLSAPSCPVERIGSPCPPRPVSAALVQARRADHESARTTTGADGSFHLDLPAGAYDIVATSAGGLASTAQVGVVIVTGQTQRVTLTVDSGIR